MKKTFGVAACFLAVTACVPVKAPTPWYQDADADGYGNPAVTKLANTKPSGYVSNKTDCDDTDPAINPAAASDPVDGIDQDCNSLVDNRSFIFSTSASYATDFGALENADAICQTHADASAFVTPGTYKAWISNDTVSAKDRLTHSVFPYVNAAGQTVANDWLDLTDGTVSYISRDENNAYTGLHNMTGTNYDGSSLVGLTCNNWTTTSGSEDVAVGLNDQIYTSWTYYTWNAGPVTHYCGTWKLYCVQQGGPVRWYKDTDKDAYGDKAVTKDAVTKPSGYVADNTDCDDARKLTNPGAAEVLGNGKDDNCDGQIDDRWYEDSDGDNYGNPAVYINSAENPGWGYSINDGDCNDTDSMINPGDGDMFEQMNGLNGIDENCNGEIDEYGDGGFGPRA